MALIKQRFLALMAGYEDLNDHDVLAMDDGFRVAVGGELASCSTLCRFERSIPQETIDKGNEFLRDFYLQHGTRKKTIIIDVDNTPVETFGLQEGRKFNGHYDCNCYLPLLAFIDGYPIGVYNGTIDGRKRMLEVLKPMVDAIKKKRPDTVILLRADSGFNNTALIDLCEELGIYYLIDLAQNNSLIRRLEPGNRNSSRCFVSRNASAMCCRTSAKFVIIKPKAGQVLAASSFVTFGTLLVKGGTSGLFRQIFRMRTMANAGIFGS